MKSKRLDESVGLSAVVVVEHEGAVAKELHCTIVQLTQPWGLEDLDVETLGLSFELLPLL